MKLWQFAVAGLYVLVLALLTIPVLAVAFGKMPSAEILGVTFGQWPYWALLLVMGAAQLVLLRVPVRVAQRRPVSRGALWPSVVVIAAAATLLVAGALLSLHAAWFGDGDGVFETPGLVLVFVATVWIFWGLVFRRLARSAAPVDFMGTSCARLVRGSILELLVAVPCHIVVRSRDYCCAGAFTLLGLAAGVSVMLFAFGPALYFLFAARARRLRAAGGNPSPAS